MHNADSAQTVLLTCDLGSPDRRYQLSPARPDARWLQIFDEVLTRTINDEARGQHPDTEFGWGRDGEIVASGVPETHARATDELLAHVVKQTTERYRRSLSRAAAAGSATAA